MHNRFFCASRMPEMCCPVDENLKKEWLRNLKKEHQSLRLASKKIAQRSKLFSNQSRIEIILMLEQREHCMDEIAKKLNSKKSAVSYHLMMLEKNGIICRTKHSRFVFYSLSKDGKRKISLFRE